MRLIPPWALSRTFALAAGVARNSRPVLLAIGLCFQALAQQPPATGQAPGSTASNQPEYSMKVTVPLVTLDVSVLTSDGLFVPGLTQDNFRVFEDGAPQKLTSFNLTQEPVRAVMLVEWSANTSAQEYGGLRASRLFVSSLREEDWAALVLYDKQPHVKMDFAQGRPSFDAALESVGLPLSKETNLFDALYDTLDRLEGMRGRKYIILLSDGEDTFSRKSYDDVLRKLEFARDTIIFPVTGGRGARSIRAENALHTFAKLSGGRLYYAMSQQDYADAFGDLARTLRNRYLVSYHSTHPAEDGAWHKIKLEVVNPDGSKKSNYQITVREGYRAKKQPR